MILREKWSKMMSTMPYVVPLGEIHGADMENAPVKFMARSSTALVGLHGPPTPAAATYRGNWHLPPLGRAVECAQSGRSVVRPSRRGGTVPAAATLGGGSSCSGELGEPGELLPGELLQPCFEKPHGVLPLWQKLWWTC